MGAAILPPAAVTSSRRVCLERRIVAAMATSQCPKLRRGQVAWWPRVIQHLQPPLSSTADGTLSNLVTATQAGISTAPEG